MTDERIQYLPVDISPENPDAWKDEAACIGADPELFVPDLSAKTFDPAPALAFCATCAVTVECRAYARRNRDWGVWGGEVISKYRARRSAA